MNMNRTKDNAKRELVILLFAALLAMSIVLAANDPGHDTLYIEQQGDSELNGSFNVSYNASLKGGFVALSSSLDIYANGNIPSGTRNSIVGTGGGTGDMYVNSPGNLYLNSLSGVGTVYFGDSGDTVNAFISKNLTVTGNLSILGEAYIRGIKVCLANGTDCPSALGGANVTGSGTENYVAKWTGATAVGNSVMYDDGTNVGIGTASPSGKLMVDAGSIPSGTNALYITGALANPGTTTETGMRIEFNSTGSSNSKIIATSFSLLSGFTGARATMGLIVTNSANGTMSTLSSVNGNAGYRSRAQGTTTGANIGAAGEAFNGNKNAGLIGMAITDKASALNIGVMGLSYNAAATPTLIGGYFGLQNSDPTFVSSALIADNGAFAVPIFMARDNGAEVFRINDGGNVGIGTTTPTQKLDVNGSINISNSTGKLYAPEVCIAGDCKAAWPAGGSGSGNVNGTGTAYYLPMWKDATTLNNSEIYQYNSNIGIGTATATQALDVNGSVNVSGNIDGAASITATTDMKTINPTTTAAPSFYVGESTSGGKYGGMSYFNSAYAESGLYLRNSAYLYAANTGGLTIGAINAAGVLRFVTGGSATERMRINSSGAVGIGTTTPTQKLDVNGSVNATTYYGAGTGLTGTAASLTAGFVTNGIYTTSTWSGGDLGGTGLAATVTDDSHSHTKSTITIAGENITAGTINAARLPTSGATAGNYGDGTHVSAITIDTYGRITSASNVTITGAAPSGAAGGDLSGTYPDPEVVNDSHSHTQTTITIAGENITSGTIADARIASTITRDSEYDNTTIIRTYTSLVGDVTGTHGATIVGDDSHIHTQSTITIAGENITSGTIASARIIDSYLFNDGDTATGNYTFDTDTLHIDSTNDRVGIGTTEPGDKLTLGSYETPNITGNQDKTIGIYGAGAAYFRGRDITNDIEFIMGTSTNGGAFVGSMTSHDLWLRTNNANRITIKNTTGDVGIGTAAPTQKLDVNGSVNVSGSSKLYAPEICLAGSCQTSWPSGADGNNYTTAISFNETGSIIQLNLARTGMTNLTATFTDSDTTYSAGQGITITSTQINHTDTSSQASIANTGGAVIQNLTLDTFGHITAANSTTVLIAEADTLATVTGRGATTTAAITVDSDGTEQTNIGGTLYINGSASGARVGIGTASPLVKLEVNVGNVSNGGANGIGIISTGDDFWIITKKNASGSIRDAIYSGSGTNPLVLQEQGGNVGIGTTDPAVALEVAGGIRMNTTAAKPTCDSTVRGTMWFTPSSGGTDDFLYACMKNSSDTYNWVLVARG